MNFTIFLKKDFLRKNNTVKEMLSQYDREGGYSDGLFSREEALNIITDAILDKAKADAESILKQAEEKRAELINEAKKEAYDC